LGCKPASTPMEANVNFWYDDSHPLDDPGRYKRLIEKLINLTVTRPDINFAVGVLSRFMHEPREAHWNFGLYQELFRESLVYKYGHVHISRYYAGDKGDRKSTTRYCTFVGGNLVTWRSNKQDVVSRSSAEAKYKAMTHTACEMIWLKNLLMKLDFR